MLEIIMAAISIPLSQFAEGALLAASVYLVGRGRGSQR